MIEIVTRRLNKKIPAYSYLRSYSHSPKRYDYLDCIGFFDYIDHIPLKESVFIEEFNKDPINSFSPIFKI